MVKKAKLDVIENLPDIDLPDIDLIDDTIPIDPELPLPVTSEKWALNKLLVIFAPVVIVVLIMVGFLWFYFARTTNIAPKQSKAPTETASIVIEKKFQDADMVNGRAAVQPVIEKSVNFKDFLIDLKDKAGKSKILACDFVLVVNTAENLAGLENREDIRNIIYQTVTGRSAVALRSIEERNNLKKELLQELNKTLGAGFVKNIYFTNYVIM